MQMTKVVILHKDAPLPEASFEELMRGASDEYRQRAAKMLRHNAENLLLGEALARRMIAGQTGAAPEALIFGRTEHGKPVLRGHADLHFNLSHSGPYIACALSPAAVGIDVQMLSSAQLRVAERFFTEHEYHYVLEADSALRFCRVWTMKESYVKRAGLGISAMPLNSFDVLSMPPGMFHEIPLDDAALCQICGEMGLGIQVLRSSVAEFLS